MKKRARLLMVLAAALLVPSFLVPLWTIDLSAPQYPEGLQLKIWLHSVSGGGPYDLQNINQLNHYIGMRPIVPEAIPELRLMPYLVGLLAFSALLIAWKASRRAIVVWIGCFLVLGLVGLVDFYLWERDYGTQLDPKAPIKVPGMTYQPPLIGSKQLLNITASSYPAAGSLFLLGGLVAGFLAWWNAELRLRPTLLSSAALVVTSCSLAPEPIRLGEDSCAHCGMLVSDARFGAELVTSKGRLFKFDSIECLVEVLEGPQPDPVHSLWVVDFSRPGKLIQAEHGRYLYGSSIESPMGRSLLAFSQAEPAGDVRARYGGRLLNWDEVRHEIRGSGLRDLVGKGRP